jgi:hypothetical protein
LIRGAPLSAQVISFDALILALFGFLLSHAFRENFVIEIPQAVMILRASGSKIDLIACPRRRGDKQQDPD